MECGEIGSLALCKAAHHLFFLQDLSFGQHCSFSKCLLSEYSFTELSCSRFQLAYSKLTIFYFYICRILNFLSKFSFSKFEPERIHGQHNLIS